MIVGIGTDIVEVDRIRDSHKKFGEKFIDRILLPAEKEYCLSHTDPAPNIAARFAAKEAIAKAFELSGGVDYLVQVAKEDPRVFCALLAKIIPTEVKADVNVHGALVDAIQKGRVRSGITIDQEGREC